MKILIKGIISRIRTLPSASPVALFLFFLTIFCTDCYMFFISQETFPGLFTENAYQKSLDFYEINRHNHYVTANWNSNIKYQNGKLTFSLTDDKKLPVRNAIITTKILSSRTQKYDTVFFLKENKEGIYEIFYKFPTHGVWHIKIKASKEKSEYFDYKRMVIKPE